MSFDQNLFLYFLKYHDKMLEQNPKFRNRIPLILCAHGKSFITCKHKWMYVPMKMLYLRCLFSVGPVSVKNTCSGPGRVPASTSEVRVHATVLWFIQPFPLVHVKASGCFEIILCWSHERNRGLAYLGVSAHAGA